jgi:hypothetical protein
MADNHIIIGLGGTGGNVIKDFRKQIIDKYGKLDVPQTKSIKYLYVDSKQSEFDESLWKYQGIDIGLKGEGTLKLQAGRLNEALETHPKPAFVGKEADWGDVRNDVELATKAGNQMRRLGRVNLKFSIEEIVDRVRSMYNSLEVGKQNPKTLIHIVVGLAGGTGSGAVVDVAAQLIKTFQEDSKQNYNVLLYLRMPELSVPKGWGGTYQGVLQGTSFYQLNGYAALKEINAMANGYFQPYDITTTRKRIDTENKVIQAAYIITERNDAGITFRPDDITASIASLLTLKIITEQVGSVVAGEGLTKILEDDIDGNENKTINPAAYWQLAAKFPVPGSYRFGVPREKIKDSLALTLILHAFNKLLYKNFDEVGGEGYRGVEPEVNEAKKEQNQIITNYRSAILREWYLEYEFLILDQPMLDLLKGNHVAAGLMTEGRDDYAFDGAFDKAYTNHYQKIFLNNLFKGKAIEDREKIGALEMALGEYFNKEYKGVGYERYVNAMMGVNLPKIAEFIAQRIKRKMFGKEDGVSRYYPMKSYIDIIDVIIQGYFDYLEKHFVKRRDEYKRIVGVKRTEIDNIKKDYVGSFGLLGSKSKRENAVNAFKTALKELWYANVNLAGIEFAIQLVHSHLKNKLLDVKDQITNEIAEIEIKRNKLEQALVQEKGKLNNTNKPSEGGISGFVSLTDEKALAQFLEKLFKKQDAEPGQQGKYQEVISKLEQAIFENKDKVLKVLKKSDGNELEIQQGLAFLMNDAYQAVDDLLSEDTFRKLNMKDNFYNAHVVQVIYNKFEGDANSTALRDLLRSLNAFAAPMAKITSRSKNKISITEAKLILLPELQGVEEGSQLISFYDALKSTLLTDMPGSKILPIKNVEYQNEITIAQFYRTVLPDMLDTVEKLKRDYDEKVKNHELKFLMHTEDVSVLPDLVPPKTEEQYKELLFPYVMVLSTVDNAFKTYKDGLWKIEEQVNLSASVSGVTGKVSDIDGDTIDIYFGTNTLEGFWNLDIEKLDEEYKNYRDEIPSFLNSFIFHAIKKLAQKYLSDVEKSPEIINRITELVEGVYNEVGQVRANPKYMRYKKSRDFIIELTNTLTK